MSIQAWDRDVARLENELRDLRTMVERIDMSGTRGILPLTITVNELAKDVAKIELTLERKLPSGINWKSVGAFIAVTAPMYALLIQQYVTATHH